MARRAIYLLAMATFFAGLTACEQAEDGDVGRACTTGADCASGACIGGVCGAAEEDEDDDGLFNHVEARLGTDPANPDSDSDGVDDLLEVRDTIHPEDADGDGVIDALESRLIDTDGDCLSDQLDPANAELTADAQAFLESCRALACGGDEIQAGGVTCATGELACAYGDLPDTYVADEGEDDCDGVDNDCDGETDEGSLDSDDDDEADCLDDDDDGDGVADDDDCLPLEPRCAEDCSDNNGDDEPDCLDPCPDGCDDGIECTTDTCDPELGCVYSTDDAACDDDVDCTNDRCDGELGCTHDKRDELCDDGLLCTTDVCEVTGCISTSDAASCDDEIACTADSCDPATGDPLTGCVHTADAAVCDDEVACTLDSCDPATGCVSEPDDAACDDGNPCTADHCDPSAGDDPCRHDNLSINDCDDGDSCTIDDFCFQGTCQGGADRCECREGNDCGYVTPGDLCSGRRFCNRSGFPYRCDPPMPPDPVECDASADDDCTHNVCNPDTGICGMQPINEGGSCDDGLTCTQNDRCDATGQCIGGAPLDCVDDVPCTEDACVEPQGCTFQPDASACEDDDNPCTDTVCDPEVGCTHAAHPGAFCDDGDDCTIDDHCAGSVCTGTDTCVECREDGDCLDDDLCDGLRACDTSSIPYRCVGVPDSSVTCDSSADTDCQQNRCNPASGVCAQDWHDFDGNASRLRLVLPPRARGPHCRLRHRVDRHGPEFFPFHSPHGLMQPSHEVTRPPGVHDDLFRFPQKALVIRGPLQQLRRAEHAGQQVIQIVAHPGCQFADCAQALHPNHLMFGPLDLRDVVDHAPDPVH